MEDFGKATGAGSRKSLKEGNLSESKKKAKGKSKSARQSGFLDLTINLDENYVFSITLRYGKEKKVLTKKYIPSK